MKKLLITAGLIISAMIIVYGLTFEKPISEKEQVYNEISKYQFESLSATLYSISPLPVLDENGKLKMLFEMPDDTLSYDDRIARELVYKFGAKKYCIYKQYSDSLTKVSIYNDSISAQRKYEQFVKTMHVKDSVYAAYLKSKCK